MNRIQEALQGYKTYILLLFLVAAEVVNIAGGYDVDIVAIRAVVLPLVGITFKAKLDRS